MQKTLKSWLKTIKLHESTISMILGGLVVVVLSVLAYNYFSSTETTDFGPLEAETEEYILELQEEDGKLIPQGLPKQHTVSQGDHLWEISKQYYGNGYNWVDIAQANSLSNPNLLLEGQELTIPKAELRVVTQEQEAQGEIISKPIESDTYEIKAGDTLWHIAVLAYQDGYQWPKIFEANRELITNPDIIEVGTVISLPR